MHGQPGHGTRPHARSTPSFVGTDVPDLTNERSFDSQPSWVIDLFLNMFCMGVCTTRHGQTSGRLVQELNVCTVG